MKIWLPIISGAFNFGAAFFIYALAITWSSAWLRGIGYCMVGMNIFFGLVNLGNTIRYSAEKSNDN